MCCYIFTWKDFSSELHTAHISSSLKSQVKYHLCEKGFSPAPTEAVVSLRPHYPVLLSFKCFSQFSSDQSLSHVRLSVAPWITACQASPSITNSRSSLKLKSIESVVPSSHLILCRPLLLLPPIPPSIRVFSNESTLRRRWPKYWSFSLSIIPSKEIPGLISFRMDWLDLLAVQGTLKSLLQHHSSKSSILQCSASFTVQHRHGIKPSSRLCPASLRQGC